MIDGDVGRRLITEVTLALDEAGIENWLQGGALLGFVREGDFLSHDHDIDFGLRSTVRMADVVSALEPLGYEFRFFAGTDELGIYASSIKDGIIIEFFKMCPDEQHFSCWSFGRTRTVLKVSPFAVKRVVLARCVTNVPHPMQRYLADLYGHKWMVEDRDWYPNRSKARVAIEHYPEHVVPEL